MYSHDWAAITDRRISQKSGRWTTCGRYVCRLRTWPSEGRSWWRSWQRADFCSRFPISLWRRRICFPESQKINRNRRWQCNLMSPNKTKPCYVGHAQNQIKRKEKSEKKKKKTTNVALHSNIYDPISFKLGMMTDTSEMCALITSAQMTWTCLQSFMRKQNLLHLTSYKFHNRFGWNLLCCHDLSNSLSSC